MNENLPIIYSGFWDFPLAFTVRWEGGLYLFFREFDDEADEYEDQYRVYLLPPWTDEGIEASWSQARLQALDYLGQVAVKSIAFDPTHRREISAAIFRNSIFQSLAVRREPVGVV